MIAARSLPPQNDANPVHPSTNSYIIRPSLITQKTMYKLYTTWYRMAKTARINSSPQNWSAWGLIISGLTEQKKLKFDWWVVIDVDYIIAKGFFIFYNLVKLFTVQNQLELGPQIPKAMI